jgi:hypothetical protein
MLKSSEETLRANLYDEFLSLPIEIAYLKAEKAAAARDFRVLRTAEAGALLVKSNVELNHALNHKIAVSRRLVKCIFNPDQ